MFTVQRRIYSTLFAFVCTFTLAFLTLGSCKKENIQAKEPFNVTFNNEHSLLQARYAAFLTDKTGKVRVFNWLNSKDTTTLSLRYADESSFDCTVVKIYNAGTPTEPDERVELVTYTNVKNESLINLRSLNKEDEADLRLQFTNITSLDSLIFPESTPLVMPQPGTNFFGNFKVNHTGDFWLLAKVNGDPSWRYFTFKNYAHTVNTYMINASLMPRVQGVAPKINFPFTARWRYHIDGFVDTEQQKVIALGDIMEEPDARVSISDALSIYRPEDVSFTGYKLEVLGTMLAGSDSYTLKVNRLYDAFPNEIEAPDFTVKPTLVNDHKQISVRCEGSFDALVVNRVISGYPAIQWSVYLEPQADNNVSYTLPQLPTDLSTSYPQLGSYSFDNGNIVIAERYRRLFGYEEVLSTIFTNADYYWQTKNELMSVEKTFY
jgi:hypothetical protein